MPLDLVPIKSTTTTKLDLTPVEPKLDLKPIGEGKLDLTPVQRIAPPVTEIEEPDTLEEIGTGLQRAFAPQTLTKEELLDVSLPQIGGQVAGEIAGSLAAGALGAKIGGGIGTLIAPGPGTAVGAGIGSLAGAGIYGLYKGIVTEEAMAKAHGRDFNPFNAALSVLVEVNPLTKGTKLARAGRQAILQAGETFQQTGDVTAAGVAGALGGGLIGITPAKIRWIENDLTPRAYPTKANVQGRVTGKDVSDSLEFLEDNSEQLLRTAQKRIDAEDLSMPESVKKTIETGDVTTPEDAEFIRWFMMRPGMKVASADDAAKFISEGEAEHFTKLANTLSDDTLEQSYKRFREGQIQVEVATQLVEKKAQELTRLKDPQEQAFLKKWLKDPLFVGREVDNIIGLNLEGSTAAFSGAQKSFSSASANYISRANKLFKEARKRGIHPERIGRALAGKQKLDDPIVDKWRKLFDEVREHQNTHGMRVGHLENYFPQISKTPGEFVSILKLRLRDLATKHGGKDLNAIPEAEDFMRAVKFLKDPAAKGQISISNKEIPNIIAKLEEPQIFKKFLGFEGSAAFKRMGEMPDFIREFDVGRAFNNYVNTNLKPIYYRPAFEQMANNVAALRGAGFMDTANYFNDYMKSMSGAPSNFSAWLDITTNKLRANAIMKHADAETRLGKYSAKAQQFLPDLIAWNTSLIYPNVLGYNMHAPLRNLTQTWMLTAPEVGGTYGYGATRRGWGRALRELKKIPRPTQTNDLLGEKQIKSVLRLDKMDEFLQEKGLAAGKFFGEGANIVSNSLRTIPGLGRGVEAIDALGEFGMTLYSGSDTANRFITYHIGKEIAEDLIKKVPSAQKFVNSMSAGGKASLSQARSLDEMGDVIGKYLVSKTQFNYGREGLNKFGRDYGKVVSMFTKWPVMIWSDMAELKKTGNSAKVLTKYIAPLAALIGGDIALEEIKATKSPVGKILLGRGLKSASPLNSLVGIDVPPLLKIPLKGAEIGKQLIDADYKKVGKDLQKIIGGDYRKAGKALLKAGKAVKGTLLPFAPGGVIPIAGGRIKKAIEGD